MIKCQWLLSVLTLPREVPKGKTGRQIQIVFTVQLSLPGQLNPVERMSS